MVSEVSAQVDQTRRSSPLPAAAWGRRSTSATTTSTTEGFHRGPRLRAHPRGARRQGPGQPPALGGHRRGQPGAHRRLRGQHPAPVRALPRRPLPGALPLPALLPRGAGRVGQRGLRPGEARLGPGLRHLPARGQPGPALPPAVRPGAGRSRHRGIARRPGDLPFHLPLPGADGGLAFEHRRGHHLRPGGREAQDRQYRALDEGIAASGLGNGLSEMEIKSIWGTRSGHRIGTARGKRTTSPRPVVFKHGNLAKLRAEVAAIQRWESQAPGFTPPSGPSGPKTRRTPR